MGRFSDISADTLTPDVKRHFVSNHPIGKTKWMYECEGDASSTESARTVYRCTNSTSSVYRCTGSASSVYWCTNSASSVYRCTESAISVYETCHQVQAAAAHETKKTDAILYLKYQLLFKQMKALFHGRLGDHIPSSLDLPNPPHFSPLF